ncbi:alkylhydroperoxidase domain protein [Corynebacterium sp. KPL2838]|uniref:alkylhydroperoxidase domain protein n=1 Tax=Corynebacterium sp. KPL2838 TaxID=3158316 RepID=UPI0032EB7917
MVDIINELSGASQEVQRLRTARPQAQDNAQLSFSALLEPEDPGTFSYAERYAIAAFTAAINHAPAAEFYFDLLSDEASEPLVAAIRAAARRGASTGPYQDADFLVFGENTTGEAQDSEGALGKRLSAACEWAHLLSFHPKDASPQALGHLDAAGWSATDIVSLSQLVSFLAFQLRVAHGLSVLSGRAPTVSEARRATGGVQPDWEATENTLQPDGVIPDHFVNHSLGWLPWVAPLPKEDFTPAHMDALIKPKRIDSEYFRLLARDPAALKARTLTDLDIFYNTEGGLSRADRELAATVVSRFNGCVYCASVHQARCVKEGGEREIVDRLLAEGITADLGSQEWDLIRRAALALTSSPISFDAELCAELRDFGFDDQSIVDIIYASSFFNWANRLMLTLGQANVPERFR